MKFVVLVVTFFGIVLADPGFLEDGGYNNSDSSGFGNESTFSPPPTSYAYPTVTKGDPYFRIPISIAEGNSVGDAPRNNLYGGTNAKRKQNLIQEDSTQSGGAVQNRNEVINGGGENGGVRKLILAQSNITKGEVAAQSEGAVYNGTALISEGGDVEGVLISASTGGNYAGNVSIELGTNQIARTTQLNSSTVQSENVSKLGSGYNYFSDSNFSVGTDSSSIPPGDESNLPNQKLETGYFYPRPISAGDFDDDAPRNNLRASTAQSENVSKFGGHYYNHPSSNFGIGTGSSNTYKFPSSGSSSSGFDTEGGNIPRINLNGGERKQNLGQVGTTQRARIAQSENISKFRGYYYNHPSSNFGIGTGLNNTYKFLSSGSSSNAFGIAGGNIPGNNLNGGAGGERKQNLGPVGTIQNAGITQSQSASKFGSGYYNNNPFSNFGIGTGSSNTYKFPSGGRSSVFGTERSSYAGYTPRNNLVGGSNGERKQNLSQVSPTQRAYTVQNENVSKFVGYNYRHPSSNFGGGTGSNNTYKFPSSGSSSNDFDIAGGNFPRINLNGGTGGEHKQNLVQVGATERGVTTRSESVSKFGSGYYTNNPGSNFGIGTGSSNTYKFPSRGSSGFGTEGSSCADYIPRNNIPTQSYPPGDETNLPNQKLETGYFYPRPITGGDFDDDLPRNNFRGETSGKIKENLIQGDTTQNGGAVQIGSELITGGDGTRERKENLSQVSTTQSVDTTQTENVSKFGGYNYKFPGSSSNAPGIAGGNIPQNNSNGGTGGERKQNLSQVGATQSVDTIQSENISKFGGFNYKFPGSSSNAPGIAGGNIPQNNSNGGTGGERKQNLSQVGATQSVDTIQSENISKFGGFNYKFPGSSSNAPGIAGGNIPKNNSNGDTGGERKQNLSQVGATQSVDTIQSENISKFGGFNYKFPGSSSNAPGIAGGNIPKNNSDDGTGGERKQNLSQVGATQSVDTIQSENISKFGGFNYKFPGSSSNAPGIAGGNIPKNNSNGGTGGERKQNLSQVGATQSVDTIQSENISKFGGFNYKFPGSSSNAPGIAGGNIPQNNSNGGTGGERKQNLSQVGATQSVDTIQSENISKFGGFNYKFPGSSSNAPGIAGGNIPQNNSNGGTGGERKQNLSQVGATQSVDTIQSENISKFGGFNYKFPGSSSNAPGIAGGNIPKNNSNGGTGGERKQNLSQVGATQSVDTIQSENISKFGGFNYKFPGSSSNAPGIAGGNIPKNNSDDGTGGERKQNLSQVGATQSVDTIQSENISKFGGFNYKFPGSSSNAPGIAGGNIPKNNSNGGTGGERKQNLSQVGATQSVDTIQSENISKFGGFNYKFPGSSSNAPGIAGGNIPKNNSDDGTGGERKQNLSQVGATQSVDTIQSENISKFGGFNYKFPGSSSNAPGIAGGNIPKNNSDGGTGEERKQNLSQVGTNQIENAPQRENTTQSENVTNLVSCYYSATRRGLTGGYFVGSSGIAGGNYDGDTPRNHISGGAVDAPRREPVWRVSVTTGTFPAIINRKLQLDLDQVHIYNSTVFCITYRNQQEAEQANQIGLSAYSVGSKNNINYNVSVYRVF